MLFMAVTRAELEVHLARVRERVADPRHGLFGPRSVLWFVLLGVCLLLVAALGVVRTLRR